MMHQHRSRVAIVLAGAFLALFLGAKPAEAFYFRLPSALQTALDSLRSSARAEDGSQMYSQPPMMTGDNFSQPAGSQPMMYQPNQQPMYQQPGTQPMMYQGDQQPQMGDQKMYQPGTQPMMYQGDQKQMYQPGQQPPQREGGQQGFMSENGGQQGDNRGQNNEQDNARFLKDMKRSANDLSRQLKQFETMTARFEKKGVKISDNAKAKIETVKANIEKLNSIKSGEDAQDLDMQGMWEGMRELEEERQNLEKMDNITREMKRMEGEINRFSQQIAKLEKSKITVPAEIKDNLEKVKAKIAEIKGGQMDNAEDLWELMEGMNQSRQTLEVLSRWPQIVKDVNREIKRLETEVKRTKTLVARLAKKGLDLSANLDKFTAEVERIKSIKADADAKVAAGAVDEALELLQNDFFGQMDDVWQEQKIIQQMSNLGRFNSDFQREINQAKREINALKRKKIDVTELEDLLNQAIAKGDEIKGMLKEKPVNYDAVIALMEELEEIGQTADNKMSELRGDDEVLPWEKGPSQFKEIKMSPTMEKLLPRKEMQQFAPTEQPTAATAPASVAPTVVAQPTAVSQ